jgi:peptidoglycan/LPS O-acetylase OafA/YrhL
MNTHLQQNKLGFLDGVRGVAALIVVFHHFGLAFFPAIDCLDPSTIHLGNGKVELAIGHTPLNLFFNGAFAVSVFFVLSGFVLSYKFHRTGSRQLLTEYAAKRYFRLVLPVAASIVICYALKASGLLTTQLVQDTTKSKAWLSDQFFHMQGPLDAVKSMFIDVFLNNDNRYNAVLWTMTIEFLGSLLLFGFLALAGDHRRTIVLHIVVAAAILLTDKKYYAAFILGSLISRLFVSGFAFPKGSRGIALKWALMLVGIYFSTYPWGGVQRTIWKPLVWSWTNTYELFHVLGAFCILLVICFDNRLRRVFSIKPFLYLGKISFSFYLIHVAILCSLGCFVFYKLYEPGNYFVPFLAAFGVSMAVTLVLSHFFYKWIDRSGIRLSDRVGKLVSRQ